jgi:5-methylcytosine-specific restriction endonuclease McrA
VVACSSCNTKKGDLPLDQTGMKLMKEPKSHYNKIQIALDDFRVSEWVEYTF